MEEFYHLDDIKKIILTSSNQANDINNETTNSTNSEDNSLTNNIETFQHSENIPNKTVIVSSLAHQIYS